MGFDGGVFFGLYFYVGLTYSYFTRFLDFSYIIQELSFFFLSLSLFCLLRFDFCFFFFFLFLSLISQAVIFPFSRFGI